jgi:hypothetical protein
MHYPHDYPFKVPDERLEAFLDLCVEGKKDDTDEAIETRELEIVLLCLEADVRDQDNIGHCGYYTDYFWEDGEWLTEKEAESDDEEEEDEEGESHL